MTSKIKYYGVLNNIPIIRDKSLKYITNLIIENNYNKVLEIGTAIGYFAINVALINKNIHITTLEKNKDLFAVANKNILTYKLDSQINLINQDALLYETNDKFDLIFIDGAKSKYLEFLEKYLNNLNPNGLIVCDNINLGVYKNKDVGKNKLRLIKKMNDFTNFINNNKYLTNEFIDIDDGLLIIKKELHL